MGFFVIIVVAVMFVLIKVRNGNSDNYGENAVSQAATVNNTYANSQNYATWQEMKRLQDDMDHSIFSGDFHVTGDGPYYVEYIGFSSNWEAFKARESFIERLYDGTPYDKQKETLCRSVIISMFGENTSMPICDRLIEDDISAVDNVDSLRINYNLPSLPHWSTYHEAERIIAGYKKWLKSSF